MYGYRNYMEIPPAENCILKYQKHLFLGYIATTFSCILTWRNIDQSAIRQRMIQKHKHYNNSRQPLLNTVIMLKIF